MYIDCLEELIFSYDNLQLYPILGVYINNIDIFIDNYIVINEQDRITICNRYNSEMIEILKDSTSQKILSYSIHKNKKRKKKLFSFGNLEVYRTSRAL